MLRATIGAKALAREILVTASFAFYRKGRSALATKLLASTSYICPTTRAQHAALLIDNSGMPLD
jgi:hypothetical protein